MARLAGAQIRELILTIVKESEPAPGKQVPNLTQQDVLNKLLKRIGGAGTYYEKDYELLIVQEWNDLFRTGYLCWGLGLPNPLPGTFFHITSRGRSTIEKLSRDPGNPHGYMSFLESVARLNPVAESYLKEALACFAAELYKGAAVMIGAASESLVLELRDVTVARLNSLDIGTPENMKSWKIKIVLDSLRGFFEKRKSDFDTKLREEFESYWMAFVHQIRTVRNDVGHPISVEPVTFETVHASFLMFPELARLSKKLRAWVSTKMI